MVYKCKILFKDIFNSSLKCINMFQFAILQFLNWVKLVCNLHRLLQFCCRVSPLSQNFCWDESFLGLDHQGFGTLGVAIWQVFTLKYCNRARATTLQQFCKQKYCPLLLLLSSLIVAVWLSRLRCICRT